MAVFLVVIGLVVAWIGQSASAVAPLGVSWTLHPASNTVTIRLTPGSGPLGRTLMAESYLVVSAAGNGQAARRSGDGGRVRVPVPPGQPTRLLVQVKGPQPFQRTVTVTVPPPLRVTASRAVRGGLRLSLSSPLRHRPRRVCGHDVVSFPAASQAAVAISPYPCRATLRLTARNGEQVAAPVNIPAMPEIPLYSFASPAGRAVYLTVDDGWTPSQRVLAIMRRTGLPVTAFLIEQAARRHLSYWRAFTGAGGTIGDHTVSHPNLTTQALPRATAQWEQARRAFGRWFAAAPLFGRPPYGAFNRAVEAAAYRAGLKTLVGWSATVSSSGIQTWNGKRLAAGEIVLLHWVPGLGRQLTRLLAVIRARHLHPMPLTQASFAGVTPQRRSLDGD
jgi:peptidoglycan/xylan/chitin deacetylase (PgdA/CDA1 family)